MDRTIEMVPGQRAGLSPEEFVELSEEARKALRRVQVEPPRLGTRGFGKFLVEFRYPIFRPTSPRTEQATHTRAAR